MKKNIQLLITFAGTLIMTAAMSFHTLAFTGWLEEDGGVIVYLNSSGERVKDAWMRRGSDMCYLDENGEVLKNQFIEYNGKDRYLDENGALAKNKWVSVLNTDDECDQDVDILWYYFDKKGDMVKDNAKAENINTLPKKSGKYFFDSDGHMLSGWQDIEGSDDKTETYYLGEDDDGRMRTEWHRLEPREDTESTGSEPYDETVWYYFDWKGRQIKNQQKDINGKYYQFDENGVMMTGWYPGVEPVDVDFAVNSYFDKNTGARVEGWFYACAQTDYDESNEKYWFYQNKKGEIFNEGGRETEAAAERSGFTFAVAMKKINGKTYGFDNQGRMITGMIDTRSDQADENLDFIEDNFSDVSGAVDTVANLRESGVFYFENEDGSSLGQLKTDKVKLFDGGDNQVQYYFRSDGQAYTSMMIDGCIYNYSGQLVKGDHQTEVITMDTDIYKKNASEEDEPLIPAGSTVIVSSNGKVKRKGTVKVDGVKYTVVNYIATETEKD